MTVASGDNCEHEEVAYRASAHQTAALRTEVHDFQCTGCEVCARIVRNIPTIPEGEDE